MTVLSCPVSEVPARGATATSPVLEAVLVVGAVRHVRMPQYHVVVYVEDFVLDVAMGLGIGEGGTGPDGHVDSHGQPSTCPILSRKSAGSAGGSKDTEVAIRTIIVRNCGPWDSNGVENSMFAGLLPSPEGTNASNRNTGVLSDEGVGAVRVRRRGGGRGSTRPRSVARPAAR